MKSIQLPKDFVLGTATASTQIEGGETNSNWNDWYRKGGIKDGQILHAPTTITTDIVKTLI